MQENDLNAYFGDEQLEGIFDDDPLEFLSEEITSQTGSNSHEPFTKKRDSLALEDELASAFSDEPEPTKAPALGNEIDFICGYLNRNPHYLIGQAHPLDHHIYPRGLWRLFRVIGKDKELVRYFDYDQLKELATLYSKGFTNEYDQTLMGEGIKDGPVRVGKPPIDPFGNLLVVTNNGNHGSLKAECEWIEQHDSVFVQYLGKDENWPQGCYAIESADKPEPDYYDPEQIRYIAHNLLGMKEWQGSDTSEGIFEDSDRYFDSTFEAELAHELEDAFDDPLEF